MSRSRKSTNGKSHVSPANPESPSAISERPRWKHWGPYLSDRQWGTVREDYSEGGAAWEFFPHDHARSRAYRWGEDGLLGISDDQGFLCFALALWNENDSILKERLFGLTGNEGNHGEDVKEAYFYLDSAPDHTYMKALYKYPQQEFPYTRLVQENQNRGKDDDEFELLDTGIFDEDRYFDVFVEYAKAGVDDIVVRVSVTNHGPDVAPLHLVPTLWFRNTWSWGLDDRKPHITAIDGSDGRREIKTSHWRLGEYRLVFEGKPELLFTENESNAAALWGSDNSTPYVKDGFHEAIIHGRQDAVNPEQTGTRAGIHYEFQIAPGQTETVLLRLAHSRHSPSIESASEVLDSRLAEADGLYQEIAGPGLTDDEKAVQRQAFAGLLWSKQFYYFDVSQWLDGDSAAIQPPESRKGGRNSSWRHVNTAEVLSMPDSWEYPWFAAWDLAFHCVAFARIDPEFAKNQLVLLSRDWYMHPNGQLPAYEWAFGDVNPPVHAWAAWEVYQIEKRTTGVSDKKFLERVFHRLLMNFTWWVNRKDSDGRNLFEGGFLGLDNIGVFDRSAPLPTGGFLEQSDATAWMGMFSLNMMSIAIELAHDDDVYEDMAIKFFDHFMYIAGALNDLGGTGIDIWDEEDGFYYDVLMLPDGSVQPLKIRSLVGLMPLLAVETLEPELRVKLPEFDRRMRWFLHNRQDLATLVPSWEEPGVGKRRLLSLVEGDKVRALLYRMLDPERFLSDHGIRSLSKHHKDHPFEFNVNGDVHRVDYQPAESRSGLFGGNSNWRGPIWFPINFLIVQTLRRYHTYYGEDFKVECPVGSGQMMNLDQVADELSRRLISTFLPDRRGCRPVYGEQDLLQNDPKWRDHILFYEYFHGDSGKGLGASHQTGWTGLVAQLLDQFAERNVSSRTE